ncbi:tyrosine decarboxylase-like [Lolium perenne]|uniref:tyrosine decarboxylase-like n=1 Tax=Lolium perenne TaxID=4522 RepID=UPI003A994241
MDDGVPVVDYKDWQISLTRRRSSSGSCSAATAPTACATPCAPVRIAAPFEDMVCADARFEVVAPRLFALVCFRLRPSSITTSPLEANNLNERLLAAVNATREGPYMSCAVAGPPRHALDGPMRSLVPVATCRHTSMLFGVAV